MAQGRIAALWVKTTKGAAMRQARRLDFVAEVGVVGDCNGDAGSARQVLLVAEESARSLDVHAGVLRENVTVGGLDVDGLASGTALRVGSAVLRVTYSCEPCAHLRRYANVEPSSAVGLRGTLAVVVAPGSARTGDAVIEEGIRYPQLPVLRADRLRWFLRRIPPGRLVTYGQLAAVVAAPPGGARSLPRALAALVPERLPVHRVVPADLAGVPGAQRALLAEEGVDLGGAVTWWPLAGLLYEPVAAHRAAACHTGGLISSSTARRRLARDEGVIDVADETRFTYGSDLPGEDVGPEWLARIASHTDSEQEQEFAERLEKVDRLEHIPDHKLGSIRL